MESVVTIHFHIVSDAFLGFKTKCLMELYQILISDFRNEISALKSHRNNLWHLDQSTFKKQSGL